MALLWFDQPAAYSTATLAQRWLNWGGNTSVVTSPQPRSGSAMIRVFGVQSIERTLGSDGGLAPGDATAIVQARYYLQTAIGNDTLCAVLDSGTPQFSVWVDAAGILCVSRGTRTGTLLGSSGYALSFGSFYYVAVKVLLHNSAGTVDVYVDNVLRLSVTGLDTTNTANATWNGIQFGPDQDSQGVCVTDILVMDGRDGTALSPAQEQPFNAILNDRKVEWLPAVAGNGANTGLTPSTGTDHGALVDDAAPDGDATYVYGSTSGVKDSYALANLPSTAVTVDAVMPIYSCSKDDAGTKTFSPLLRIAGADYDSSTTAEIVAQELPSVGTYRYLCEILTRSPATGTLFTASEVNGMELGEKVL